MQAEHIRQSTRSNPLAYGDIEPMHIVNAQIAKCAHSAARELGIHVSENNIGDLLGEMLKAVSAESVPSMPEAYKTAALTLAKSFNPESIHSAYAALNRTFEAVPQLKDIPWHRRWEFVVDTPMIEAMEKKFGIARNPFMIALYDGGVDNGFAKDDVHYAEALANGLEEFLVTRKDEPLTHELITAGHDKVNPENPGINAADVFWGSRYTPEALQENRRLVQALVQDGIQAVIRPVAGSTPLRTDTGAILTEQMFYGRKAIPLEHARALISKAIDDYKTSMIKAGNDEDAKALAISTFCGKLQKLHPYRNGNHRAFGVLLMMRCLLENNMAPSLIGMTEYETLSSRERAVLLKHRQGYVEAMKQSPVTASTPIEELRERLPYMNPEDASFGFVQGRVLQDHIENGAISELQAFFKMGNNQNIEIGAVLTSAIQSNKLEIVEEIMKEEFGSLKNVSAPNQILANATIWASGPPNSDMVNALLSGNLFFHDKPGLTLSSMAEELRESGHEEIAEMLEDKIEEQNEAVPSSRTSRSNSSQ
jgi:hypothetical protein